MPGQVPLFPVAAERGDVIRFGEVVAVVRLVTPNHVDVRVNHGPAVEPISAADFGLLQASGQIQHVGRR